MDDKATRRGGGAVVVMVLIAALVVLPMVYVLSIGPIAYLDTRGGLPESWDSVLRAVYRPLAWAGENVPGLESVLTPYINWWVEVPPPATAPAPAPSAALAPGGS